MRDAVLTAQKQAVAAPSSGQASGHLGMVLQANSLNQPALLSYQRAIRLDPKEFSWRYYSGGGAPANVPAGKGTGRSRRARCVSVPAMLPRSSGKGICCSNWRASRKAPPRISRSWRRILSSAEALYGMARVKQAQQDMTAAEDLYRRACQAYPTFGAAYYGLATAGRSLGHEAESAKNFELAKRYKDDHPPVDDPLLGQVAELSTGISRRLEESNQLAKQGKMEEAAKLNEELLQRDPENLSALVNLLYLARFVTRLDDQLETHVRQGKKDRSSKSIRL